MDDDCWATETDPFQSSDIGREKQLRLNLRCERDQFLDDDGGSSGLEAIGAVITPGAGFAGMLARRRRLFAGATIGRKGPRRRPEKHGEEGEPSGTDSAHVGYNYPASREVK